MRSDFRSERQVSFFTRRASFVRALFALRIGLVSIGLNRGLLPALVVLAALVLGDESIAQGRRPPAAGVNLPLFRQAAPGLLYRPRFVARDARKRQIELWDLLVGPGRVGQPVTFPGPAVLEVRGGRGLILVGNQRQELRAGAGIAVPERVPLRFVNGRKDLGFALRATIVVGQNR